MNILAVDPGTEESGWVLFDSERQAPVRFGTAGNTELLEIVAAGDLAGADALAIEMVASYGMAVGRDVFETVRWIGRFQQAWHDPDAVDRQALGVAVTAADRLAAAS